MKFGTAKNISVGQIYMSTNRKIIQVESVNETHFRYVIISCNRKTGRPKTHVAGAVFTVNNGTISNFVGPIDFGLENIDLWGYNNY